MSQFVLAHHKCFLLYETERETLITGRAGARERAMLRPQLFAVRCRTTSQTFREELYIYRFDGCRCMHHNYYSHHVAVVHIRVNGLFTSCCCCAHSVSMESRVNRHCPITLQKSIRITDTVQQFMACTCSDAWEFYASTNKYAWYLCSKHSISVFTVDWEKQQY